jgi:proline iminopeptidase
LLLRLARSLTAVRSELQFFYQEGSSWLFPEAFDEYLAPIPEAERHDLVLAYHAQLNSVDDETRLRAAKAWSKWEMATSRLFVDDAKLADAENDAFAK